ncbi:MAG: formate--tetrahydrofolate ligase, partial [Alphaproteobacteria bacterium]
DAELDAIAEIAKENGVEVALCTHWADGGAGAEDLAHKIVAVADSGKADYKPLYPDDMPLWDKIKTVATQLYRANDIIADTAVRNQIKRLQETGFGNLPICMAKTQYSFSTDPALRGAPTGHDVPIREVRLSAGAGFIVVIAGAIMTMPGLPREPAAHHIKLGADGLIEGLS